MTLVDQHELGEKEISYAAEAIEIFELRELVANGPI